MNNRFSRRKMLSKSAGSIAGIGSISVVSAQKGGNRRGTERSISDFKVVGTKKTTVEFNPKTITVTTIKKSKDLKKRFGLTPPKLTETTTHDRTELKEDPFPEEGKRVSKKQWETEMATRDEWEEILEEKRGPSGISAQGHASDPTAGHHCARAEWNFEVIEEENIYDKKSPINVILRGVDADHVGEVLANRNWTDLETDGDEHARYAYDLDRGIWVGPDNEPLNAYTGWGSKDGQRILGGYHVRAYELEAGVVSIQAHEDTAIPSWSINPDDWGHEVASYETAKDRIVDIFTNLNPLIGGDDEYPIDPIPSMSVVGTVNSGRVGYWSDLDSDDQHNGKAVVLDYPVPDGLDIDGDYDRPKELDVNCHNA